jgi:hypothetical protein
MGWTPCHCSWPGRMAQTGTTRSGLVRRPGARLPDQGTALRMPIRNPEEVCPEEPRLAAKIDRALTLRADPGGAACACSLSLAARAPCGVQRCTCTHCMHARVFPYPPQRRSRMSPPTPRPPRRRGCHAARARARVTAGASAQNPAAAPTPCRRRRAPAGPPAPQRSALGTPRSRRRQARAPQDPHN